jgi:hypothetical protein
MKKMIIALILTAIMLSGCAVPEMEDGYQFGDISHLADRELISLLDAIHTYCDKNRDSVARKTALAIIRVYYPLVPANGICMTEQFDTTIGAK